MVAFFLFPSAVAGQAQFYQAGYMAPSYASTYAAAPPMYAPAYATQEMYAAPEYAPAQYEYAYEQASDSYGWSDAKEALTPGPVTWSIKLNDGLINFLMIFSPNFQKLEVDILNMQLF